MIRSPFHTLAPGSLVPGSLVPGSLAGRTILLLLVGLTVSHLLSMVIYSSERMEAVLLTGEDQTVERIATIAHVIDEVPEQWRQAIATAASSPALRVALSARPDPGPADPPTAPALSEAIRRHLDGGATRRVFAATGDTGGPQEAGALLRWLQEEMIHLLHGARPAQVIRAAIETRDGAWVTFHSPVPDFHPSWFGHAGISALVMGTAILLLSFWVVRHLTRPLSQVAAAAERLGRDVDAPPLPETGPKEVRMVAQAFNRMQERLRRFVEDRTRMLAAISHDLRTPITLLRLRTEFIAETEERIRMQATLEGMEAMIAATLSFARNDMVSEPSLAVDIVSLLSSICDDMADVGLPVTFEPEGRIPLECRPTALRRAFTNLIDNALNYGGTARVFLEKSGTAITIKVEDDGPGVPEDEQENVFKPFYRLEHSRNLDTGGVGLGLSVARTVIHAHGGDIGFRNRAEGGLRVTVTLPLPLPFSAPGSAP